MSFLVENEHAVIACCRNFRVSAPVANIIHLIYRMTIDTPHVAPADLVIRHDRKGFQIWRDNFSLFAFGREIGINDLPDRSQARLAMLANQNGGLTCYTRANPQNVSAQGGIGHYLHQTCKDAVGDSRVAALTAPDGLIDFIDKHDARTRGDDRFERSFQAALGVSDPFAEDLAEIEFDEGHTRLLGQCFRQARLAGSCWSHE